MAISATISRVALNIADMDRQYYDEHELTVAMHPSETAYRLMVRVIAFALNAQERLVFTKGLGAGDEAELWARSLSDEIELWIDFGQVDEKRIRKACGRAKHVRVYTYHSRKAKIWWDQHRQSLARHDNLEVYLIEAEGADALVGRNMQIHCSIEDSAMYLSDATQSIVATVTRLD